MFKLMVVDGTVRETMDLHSFTQCAKYQSGFRGGVGGFLLIVTQYQTKFP